MGGVSYYDNLLTCIRQVDIPKKHTLVGLIPDGDQEPDHLLNHFDEICHLPANTTIKKIINRAGAWTSNHQNFASLVPESSLSQACRRAKAEVVFLVQDPFTNFRVPNVCWFPDFQYLHMPDMFNPQETGTYAQIARNMARYASRVMLSSHATQEDFDHNFPEYKDKVQVIPFAVRIDDDIYREDPRKIADIYHLPDKFFYLPNQFWKHKNHRTVLEALENSVKSDPMITVAASGSLTDFRNLAYPSEFAAEISRRGLRKNFILLGLIPRAHVYGLMRQTIAVLQPSVFEGWSTSVEEAKSLGKQVVASDLGVLREQNAPGAVYFDPHDPQELAKLLIEVHRNSKPGIDPLAENQARESMLARVEAFGTSFLTLMEQAAGR
jgi:glycosyltransferase involved in cell wall biosynthesis